MTYISFPVETDPEQLAADAIETLQAYYPGWVPAAGAVETILIEAFARMAALTAERASSVTTEIFRYFGGLVGVLPLNATSAAVQSTWAMRDTAGYTIPSGTTVGVRATGDVLIPFRVQAPVTVPPGSSATAAGEVTLVAVDAGAFASGLGGVGATAELVDQLDYVASVTLTAITTGGIDGETTDVYLDRLSARLRLLAPRPILPADFAVFARDVAWVARALVLDGYNPADSSSGNERMVAVYAVDADGEAGTSGQRSDLDAHLQALREVNFVVNVATPTYTTVDVTYTAVTLAGFDPTSVHAAIDAALAAYLDPAAWGRPTGTESQETWINQTVVRKLEIAQVINDVPGVNYLSGDPTIGLGGGAQTAADHTLTGAAPLPRPGAFVGTVT